MSSYFNETMNEMSEYLRQNLRALWIMVALLSLVLPVFVPSFPNSHSFFPSVIGMGTVSMFILSFPSSLFALPAMSFVQATFGFDPNTIGGMYLNLVLMFALGFVQWFLIFPRVWRNKPGVQSLGLPRRAEEILLTETAADRNFGFYDRRSRSPLERAIDDERR